MQYIPEKATQGASVGGGGEKVGKGTVDTEMWQVSYSPVGEGVTQIFIYIILLSSHS